MNLVEGFESLQSQAPIPAWDVVVEQVIQALWASLSSFMTWKLWPTFQVRDWVMHKHWPGGAYTHGSFAFSLPSTSRANQAA